jgi:hypothetical protein
MRYLLGILMVLSILFLGGCTTQLSGRYAIIKIYDFHKKPLVHMNGNTGEDTEYFLLMKDDTQFFTVCLTIQEDVGVFYNSYLCHNAVTFSKIMFKYELTGSYKEL